MTHPLLFSRADGIATLQFNRPAQLNALDVPTAQALLAAVQEIAADRSVRAVLLKGAGRAFVAGGDLATLQANPVQGARDLLEPLNAAVTLLHGLDAPVIAQVHGAAAGAGLSLMLMCDFVLAAEGTKFNLAYINLGTSCDVGASWALPRWWAWPGARDRPAGRGSSTPPRRCAWASSTACCPLPNWTRPPRPSPSASPAAPRWPMARCAVCYVTA